MRMQDFKRLFTLNGESFLSAIKAIKHPVGKKEDSRNIRARNTISFKSFIIRECMGRRKKK